jgi:hypothetical protein
VGREGVGGVDCRLYSANCLSYSRRLTGLESTVCASIISFAFSSAMRLRKGAKLAIVSGCTCLMRSRYAVLISAGEAVSLTFRTV